MSWALGENRKSIRACMQQLLELVIRTERLNFQMNNIIEKYSSNFLSTALIGTAMALILLGKVFGSDGYTFFTVSPAVLLLICLWSPFLFCKYGSKNGPS